ncbi:methyltransferase domain-containing protein [Pelagibius sp. CAU 1746]|uniref:class I SAM-dependent methyltransferase n=1 Tax=Pelagibius sp. CAU 1746 TaxID=3140370 RepID=UPI00325B290B
MAPLRRNLGFLRRWLQNPKAVGAVVPSGRSLACAMVAGIDLEAPGTVVELGGGTGNITAALLEAGVPSNRIAVVERDPGFARVIAARFPEVTLLQGDAAELRRLLRDAGIGPVKAVVSGLPLLSIPDRVCLRIIAEAVEALQEDGVLLQFTYGPASPVSRRILTRLGLQAERINWVVDNIPPASVWRYRVPQRVSLQTQQSA